MADTTTTRLFVYGTLKPGHSNFSMIEHLVRSTHAATTDGVLVDLGAYPAMIPGHGIVKGVLLELDQEALVITDRIEGFKPGGGRNLFIRKESIVRLEDGQKIAAWVYLFANPEQIAGLPKATIGCVDGAPVYQWPAPK